MEQDTLGKRLRRRYLWVLLIIVVVAGLITAAILYFRSPNNTAISNKPVCHGAFVNGKCQATSSTNQSKTKSPVASVPASPTPNAPSSNANSTATTSLSNTGPGDVTGLFVGAVIIGSLVHLAYFSNRRGKSLE